MTPPDEEFDAPEQVRHRTPAPLERPREIVVACPPMHSHVNLSRIVRAAGVCGVPRIIACGQPKVDRKIARDGADTVEIEVHRSLPPVLRSLQEDGYRIVALEQTDRSHPLYEYAFSRKTALVIGHERDGLDPECLRLAHDLVEIPVYGLPYAHNAATACAIALYEYCRQFPKG